MEDVFPASVAQPIITTDIERATMALRAGWPVAIPTETVYGLAADASNAEAVQRVFALKQRPSTNPLIVHLVEEGQVTEWAHTVTSLAKELMQRFWPGPLTLVLPAKPHVSRIITAGQDTVALRMPAHPIAQKVLTCFGRGLVAPSANRYMSISPTCAQHVVQQFPNTPLWVLDGGECEIGLESTIISVLPGEAPQLLRAGMIPHSQIESALGTRVIGSSKQSLRVPGQALRHYAPNTPCWCFEDITEDYLADSQIAWLWCGEQKTTAGPSLNLGSDPYVYARGFYAALYRLDHLGKKRLFIKCPPKQKAWAAIVDRMKRASHPLA